MSKPYPTPRLGISAPQAVSKISGCGGGAPYPIGGVDRSGTARAPACVCGNYLPIKDLRFLKNGAVWGGGGWRTWGPSPTPRVRSLGLAGRSWSVCVWVWGRGPASHGGRGEVVLLVLRAELGSPRSGVWSVRIKWMVSERGGKNGVFLWSGTGFGIGCLSIHI